MADGPLALLLVLRTGLRRTLTQTPRPPAPRFSAGVFACVAPYAGGAAFTGHQAGWRSALGASCPHSVVRFAVRAGSRADKGAAAAVAT